MNVDLICLGLLVNKFFKCVTSLKMELFLIKFLEQIRLSVDPLTTLKSFDLSNVEKYKKNKHTLGYFFIMLFIKNKIISIHRKKFFIKSEWFFNEEQILIWANPNSQQKFNTTSEDLKKLIGKISDPSLINNIDDLCKCRESIIVKIKNSNNFTLLSGEHIYFINNLLLELEQQVREFLRVQELSCERLSFVIELLKNNISILKQGLKNVGSHY